MKFFAAVSLITSIAAALPLEGKRDPHPAQERHFITMNGNEFAALQSQGYAESYNTDIGYAYDHQVPGTVPCYRFYNQQYNLHLWTTDGSGEGLTGQGWNSEGIVWWMSDTQTSEWSVTVDRYREDNNDHLYTKNYNGEVGEGHYVREGTFGFTAPDASNGKLRIYSLDNQAFS